MINRTLFHRGKKTKKRFLPGQETLLRISDHQPYIRKAIKTPAATAEPITPEILLDMAY